MADEEGTRQVELSGKLTCKICGNPFETWMQKQRVKGSSRKIVFLCPICMKGIRLRIPSDTKVEEFDFNEEVKDTE